MGRDMAVGKMGVGRRVLPDKTSSGLELDLGVWRWWQGCIQVTVRTRQKQFNLCVSGVRSVSMEMVVVPYI